MQQVPNFSLLIRAAMQSMRTMPIILDPEEDGWELPDSGRSSEWGKTLGHGLRAAQFHSTLSNELMVCLEILQGLLDSRLLLDSIYIYYNYVYIYIIIVWLIVPTAVLRTRGNVALFAYLLTYKS